MLMFHERNNITASFTAPRISKINQFYTCNLDKLLQNEINKQDSRHY